jgi:hypothetical protein
MSTKTASDRSGSASCGASGSASSSADWPEAGYREAHNADVDEEFLREGACAHMHLPTGRICTLRHGHRGSCEFVPRDSVSIPLAYRQTATG